MTKIGNRISRTVKEDENRDWCLVYYTYDVAFYLERYKHGSSADKSYCATLVRQALEAIRQESESAAKRLKNNIRGIINVTPDLEGLLEELVD